MFVVQEKDEGVPGNWWICLVLPMVTVQLVETLRFCSKSQTSLLFGYVEEAEPVGSADGSQCLCLLRGCSQCLPY